MRAVVQRVSEASVSVAGEVLAGIRQGLLVLLAVGVEDDDKDIAVMVDKICNLRVFERDGKFDLSLKDVGGEVLLVSQFTLYGDTRKGRRPSFTEAAPPERARELYERALERFRAEVPTEGGRFQEKMAVGLVNDGPVTIILDSRRS